jgi:hypothetical protein
MRRFKVKDLMINVMPEGGPQEAVPGVAGCGINISIVGCGNSCVLPSCPAVSVCGLTLGGCGGGLTLCAGATYCIGRSRIGGCDPDVTGCVGECSIQPCSANMCTGHCSDGCSPVASLTVQGCVRFGAADQLEELALLKAQLTRTLQQIEAQHRTVQAQMEPQTLEEVETLETKLSEALDEVRARKAELQNKPPKT